MTIVDVNEVEGLDGHAVTIRTTKGVGNRLAVLLHNALHLEPDLEDLRGALDRSLIGAKVKQIKPRVPGAADSTLDALELLLYGTAQSWGRLWIAYPDTPHPRCRVAQGGDVFVDPWPSGWIAFPGGVSVPKLEWSAETSMWIRTALTLPDSRYMVGWERQDHRLRLVFHAVRLVTLAGSLYEFELLPADGCRTFWCAYTVEERTGDAAPKQPTVA